MVLKSIDEVMLLVEGLWYDWLLVEVVVVKVMLFGYFG